MSDLLPCPFCGAEFKMGQEPHDTPYVGGFFYLYHDYGPLGSAARNCPISVGGHYETAELAAAAWNRRALPAASSEDVRAGALDPATLEAVARMFDAIGSDAPLKGYECAKGVRGMIPGAKP